MPYLKITPPLREGPLFDLSRETIVIGRDRMVDLQLKVGGPSISRRHCRLRKRGDTYLIKDLSRNGTFVNDTLLEREQTLKAGDRIVVGSTTLTYMEGEVPTSKLELSSETPQSMDFMDKAEALSQSMIESTAASPDPSLRENLLALNRLSKELLSIRNEQALTYFLTGKIHELFQGDCCAVVYCDPLSKRLNLETKAMVCSTPAQSSPLKISQTVVQAVIDERMALMITDARRDDRFKVKSIVDRGIKSILCAPLWHEDQVFGLIYLDTVEKTRPFSPDHLGLLCAVANLAAVKIDNLRLFAASVAKAEMEKELALAATIQKGFLPGESYLFANFECIGFNRPSRQVSGDYFDFIPLNEDVLSVTMADVSGTGPPAALLMSACKSMLTALIEAGVPLQERVIRLNRYLIRYSDTHQFITCFHAEIDRRKNTLIYCNAGHNPPILLTSTGEAILLEPTGMLLGVMEAPYEVGEAPFEPGMHLTLFTDGITETFNRQEEEYGEARLLDLVKAYRTRPAVEVKEAILRDIDAFSRGMEHHDDVTLAIVRWET